MGHYPAKLFEALDSRWGQYVERLKTGDVGLTIPPVTAIVLGRCAKRGAIPRVLRDLRDEWERPRKRLWSAINELEDAQTLGQADDAMKGLVRASELMMPGSETPGMPTFRNFWALTTASAAGAATAALSGGDPIIGAGAGGIKAFADVLTGMLTHGGALLRTGAFDLCREVGAELTQVPRMAEIVGRLLTSEERKTLRLS